MSDNVLTRDNPLLSRLTRTNSDDGSNSPERAGSLTGKSEIDFTELPTHVAAYVEQGLAANTRRAYATDLAHFEAWGGVIPTTDQMVAEYVADHAETLSVATLIRRLASISKAHTAKGLTSPTSSELVRATMRGIKRTRGTAQKEAKPLLRDDLLSVLESMGNDVKSIRDRALLLIGFAGGFRRSELVGLNVEDIEHVRQGLIVHLRRSKTDQTGEGRRIGVPFGRTRWCPVMALGDWLTTAEISDGAIFRGVNRHGQVLPVRLSGEGVSLVVKSRLSDAGFDPSNYSGHSLRAGFVTSAASAGAATWKIRAQTGHASDVMLARYIRSAELFHDNAASRLL